MPPSAGSAATAAKFVGVIEGDLLLGRFTVGERIGCGGNATVHRAWDERLCRQVAVKAIEGDAAGRVLREAHAAARLNHSGIVTIYELGQEAGIAYLVTELVEGPNLRQLASSGELTDRDVAEIGAELCCSLAHAHAQGVIHRDVKPDNVLIRHGRAKRTRQVADRTMLADFGIASLVDESALTATGQVVGTLAYMAPEQAAGEVPTPAVDIYALALMLYEIWTGVNPVAGPNPASTARAIGTELPTLAELRPELPQGLCDVIDAALDPSPELRPSLGRLREAIEAARGGLHPDRPVPELAQPSPAAEQPADLPLRPLAVLTVVAVVAAAAMMGVSGLAIAAAIVVVPAVLLLRSPAEWASPAIAPLLGAIGAAPTYLVVAANHPRPEARIVLAALGWAWAALAGVLLGIDLGIVPAAEASGWPGSPIAALTQLLEPLLSAEAVASALVWVGAVVLLGAILDAAAGAMLALFGLLWAAGLVAALGAVGGASTPTPQLTLLVFAALGWIAWERNGRPEVALADLGAELGARLRGLVVVPQGAAAADPPSAPGARPSNAGPARPSNARRRPAESAPRQASAAVPRAVSEAPLAAHGERAQRAATRHLRAALHQPSAPPPRRSRFGARKKSRIRVSA